MQNETKIVVGAVIFVIVLLVGITFGILGLVKSEKELSNATSTTAVSTSTEAE